MPLIRSISGLRATVDDSLSPDVIIRHVRAFHDMQPPGPIVVGRDGRPSGQAIQDLTVATLQHLGRTVHVIGLAPTPTVQLATEHSNAAGGISITASHNPAAWNGLKFVGADGVFLAPDAAAELFAAADHASPDPPSEVRAPAIDTSQALTDHIDAVLALPALAGYQPPSRPYVAVVDAVNASGSFIVPALLRSLGYQVVELYCNGNGLFPHTPEPLAENLTDLSQAVRDHGADVGIAVDPDADRLVLLDHTGAAIGEEYTVTLSALAVYEAGEEGPAAINYSTTRMVDDVAARFGHDVHRAPVGEINVVRTMHHHGCIIGGEGSGGVIYPACHAGRDSLVGIALVTTLLARRGTSLRDVVDSLPSYAMVKTKVDLANPADADTLLEAVANSANGAILHRDDGVHCAWSDRWLHVRASNTEPILRVIAEAPDAAAAQALVQSVYALKGAL
jgi:phosphomannomutase